ncbi:hypothetical protein CLSAB_18770 [Clostridium saccharobutylicum]|uniref:hypothetical protein n=1 Tax=Clostridium saccharobutylicum TaxID=169679 RepID=UPI00098CC69A|nr:hypothetical protein [Clostridium saccharobutylicum]OOM17157.1 hypothetical protein CLSAB_18770 [Clostridium saccharobutylicum]
MNDYRYTLIISQYYHSYHYFIVEFNKDTFVKQMQELTKELNKYKSGNKEHTDIEQSDPFYNYEDNKIRYRYNVNADGDIYFLNAKYVNWLQGQIREYQNTARQMNKGYKKKSVLDAIWEHHNYDKVFKIIEKHFTIA